MNGLDSAVAGMTNTLHRVAGNPVKYERKEAAPFNCSAVGMNNEYEVIGDDGTLTVISARDFLFDAVDLQNLQTGEPRKNDRITETRGASVKRYDVMPIGKKPCFEPHDDAGLQFIVHTIEAP